MTRLRGTAVFSAAGALFLGSIAMAQADQPELNEIPSPKAKKNVEFTVSAGGMYMFETSIDAGGDFEVARGSISVGAESRIQRDLILNLGFGFEFSSYNFSGDTALGGPDPWGDVQTFDLAGILRWEVSDDWSLFGGPVFQFSRESGADFGDSFTGGGIAGATFMPHPDLVIGGGIGVITRLEDSVRAFPVLLIDWHITSNLRLSSTTPSLAARYTGLEFIYDLGGGWETGVGGAYDYHRFRLDDDGIAPEGVGEESSIPLWVRLGYGTGDNFSFNLYAGINFNGELNLDDAAAEPITEESFDSAIIVGASASITF